MLKLATIVIIALLGTSVYGSVTFSGNVSMSGSATDWHYRRTTLGWLGGLGWFSSFEAERSGQSYSGDLIIGGIKGGGSYYPSQFLAYYTANVSFGIDENVFSEDFSGSHNFIGNTYLRVVEKDTAGDVVATMELGGESNLVVWTTGDVQRTGSPKSVTFTATTTGTAGIYSVSFTVIVSDVTGVVSLGGAIVTPKVMETVVEINSWPYASSTNTLTLVTVAATGAGSSERNILASGSSTSQVYYQLSDSVVVSGGNTRSVTITTSAAVLADLNDVDLIAKVNGRFSDSGSVQFYNITFPAGASSITYDPTLGSGATVTSQQGAAATTMVSFFFVALFSIVAVLL